MKAGSRWCCVAAIAAMLHVAGVSAVDYKRLDGLHRVEKQAQISAPARLLAKRDEEALSSCAASLSLCPADLDGGCCPDGYECAKESCYATTKGPSTCGTKIGYHACAFDKGGGCCPDGLICERGSNCIPPHGSSYTFGCPTNYFLCPSSLNYGCCPNGMGCAANQCYHTQAQTVTTAMVITTTKDGDKTTVTSTMTSVRTPSIPTAVPTFNSGEEDQKNLKFFPSAVPKVTAEAVKDEGENQGLSKGALGGIVAGALIFLIIVVAAAWIVLRRLNKVAAAVSASHPSSGSRSRPPMRQAHPTESEIDGVSVDPLMVSPPGSTSPGVFRFGRPTPDPSVHSQAPSSFAGGYQAVSPSDNAQPQYDMSGNIVGYFDHPPMKPRRTASNAQSLPRVSEDSQTAYGHGRQWSNASEGSGDYDMNAAGQARSSAKELEGEWSVPELVGSPPGFVVSPLEEMEATFPPIQSLNTSWKKSKSKGYMRSEPEAGPASQLDVVNEEGTGHSVRSYRIMGQPAYQSVTQGPDEDDVAGVGSSHQRR